MQTHTDTVIPFVFESLPVRGALIQLKSAWQRMQLGHDYRPPVLQVLGHSAAAAGLIAQSLKFEGTVTLQISGDGPLSILVMQCSNDLHLRGMANAPGAGMDTAYRDLVANARCAITLDAGAMARPYQGIVEVSGNELADSLQNYYRRSVQVPSHMQLVSERGSCGGILLQQLPGQGAMEGDDWNRLGLLMATLRSADISEGVGASLLHRLFAEDDLRLFEPRALEFRCKCSRKRAADVLRLLGEADARLACAEQGHVEVTCEYCGLTQRFDAVDIARLFAGEQAPVSDSVH